jgi:ADP-ribose pyrophosphatase YjhB (NUDIX family)
MLPPGPARRVGRVPTPEFVLALREKVGTAELWMPSVTAVVVRDGEILLVQRADNGAWTPITGILDPGKEPAVGAAREALEETGVEIRVERLAAVGTTDRVTYSNGDQTVYLDHVFACSYQAGEPHVADDESVDVRWWPVDGLPDMSVELLARIDAALSGEPEARFRR